MTDFIKLCPCYKYIKIKFENISPNKVSTQIIYNPVGKHPSIFSLEKILTLGDFT